jgi:hypothetical protein
VQIIGLALAGGPEFVNKAGTEVEPVGTFAFEFPRFRAELIECAEFGKNIFTMEAFYELRRKAAGLVPSTCVLITRCPGNADK